MRHLFPLLFALVATASAHDGDHSHVPPWQAATAWPDRIITTIADDPATTIAVTWRTNPSIGRTIAQIAKATPDARFDISAVTMSARTQQIDIENIVTDQGKGDSLENFGLGHVHYHSVIFEGLEPDTLYAWRVQGARGNWSEWFQTRTAPLTGPVSFVYFGDAQNGIRSHWSRVIRMANQAAPDADFFLHAGDLVQKGDSDYNWAEWFEAGSFIHAQTPTVPVPGNHENINVRVDGDGARMRVRTPLWRPQFTLPIEEDLPTTLHEMVYDVRYSEDLHIFVVDSARTSFKEQGRWLDNALAESDARWKIVSMHHPYFVPPSFDGRKQDTARRETFEPIISKHSVDMVLAGHIHTYARSSLADTSERTSRVTTGSSRNVKTVFTISSSGAKTTDLDARTPADVVADGHPDLGDLHLDRIAGNTPMFQVIKVDGDTLIYEARMATGVVYDSFTLTKSEGAVKTLTEGAPTYGDTRLFSNTGDYRGWLDLR